MQFTQHHLKLFAACALTFISIACGAQESIAQPAKVKDPHSVSAEQIRSALSSPDHEVFQTLLGPLIIQHSYGKTPGKLFLNGELIYTARVDEPFDYNRSGHESFDLQEASVGSYGPDSLDDNNKSGSERRITKMVVREKSITCQYRVLDFTGPKVWISEGFPKKAFEYNNCNEMTYVDWPKKGKLKGFGFFYFGDEPYLWDKEGYHGNTAAYNPRLKAVFENVDIPIPPHDDRLYYKRLEH